MKHKRRIAGRIIRKAKAAKRGKKMTKREKRVVKKAVKTVKKAEIREILGPVRFKLAQTSAAVPFASKKDERPFRAVFVYAESYPKQVISQASVGDPVGHMYWDMYNTSAYGGFISYQDLCQNSPYDPYVPLGGHQPRGWDEISSKYSWCRVTKMKIVGHTRVDLECPIVDAYAGNNFGNAVAQRDVTIFLFKSTRGTSNASGEQYASILNVRDNNGYPYACMELKDKAWKVLKGKTGQNIPFSMTWTLKDQGQNNEYDAGTWHQTNVTPGAPYHGFIGNAGIIHGGGCGTTSQRWMVWNDYKVYFTVEFSDNPQVNPAS